MKLELKSILIIALVSSIFLASGCSLKEKLGGITSGAEQKPKYYCEQGEECKIFKTSAGNCTESIIIVDFKTGTERIEITNLSDTCRFDILMKRNSRSILDDKSMTCNVPLRKSEVVATKGIMESLKYCEGPLKKSYLKLRKRVARGGR